ncbi:MAG: hypothetical protein JNM39_11030 [Bdellovibrionaceae bacterium]|nr:hypothetical protein [Pseudobdellovibrionaceae bacterium]
MTKVAANRTTFWRKLVQGGSKKWVLIPFFLSLVSVSLVHGEEASKQNVAPPVFELAPIGGKSLPKTSLEMQDLVRKGLSDSKLTLSEKAVYFSILSYWKEDFAKVGKKVDYLDPKGRYQATLKQLFSVIPESELVDRIQNGDLKAVAEYTDEVKADNGNPATRLMQRYGQVNNTLWNMYKRSTKYKNQSGPKGEVTAPIAEGSSDRMDRKNLNDVISFVRRFDEALGKLPSFTGHLFRGTAITLTQASEILSGNIKELFMPAYTSTSLDIGDAFDFIRLSRKPLKKLSTLMVIEGTGKLISFRGDFQKEEEILIPRNATFQITNAIKVDAGSDEDPWDWMILFLRQK